MRYRVSIRSATLAFCATATLFSLWPWSALADWTALPKPCAASLNDVCFPTNSTTGYTVGSSGSPFANPILKTTNGGASWDGPGVCTPENLWSVCFPTNAQVGYVAGNDYVYKTTDGGSSWNVVLQGYGSLMAVCFPGNTQVGYVVGQVNTILKTTNGGADWVQQDTPSVYWGNFMSVDFPVDAQTGYAAGTCYDSHYNLYMTQNGGTTWFDASTGTPDDLNGICFPSDAQTGYVVGDYGAILKTTNAGVNWTSQASGVVADLHDVDFPVNSQVGYAVGSGGVVLKTLDGGTTWAVQRDGTSELLNAVCFPVDAVTGYVIGALGDSGVVLKTSDGGGNWVTEAGPSVLRTDGVGLHLPYPDPFRQTTTLRYSFAARPRISASLSIYSTDGRRVRVFTQLHSEMPSSRITWNGKDDSGRGVPAGAYVCRLVADGFAAVRTVTLCR
ncbi:MAG: YCF48-related protein [candidate division WOR-3 bacterium]|nr:YCF48-related protein [candidate division WOR-3 bacterium]